MIGKNSDKKLEKIVRENGFVQKLTKQNHSHQRYINIQFYRKNRIPIIHQQFFQIISSNSQYVRIHCNGLNNPFHFACRRWMINQLFDMGIVLVTIFENITLE